MIPGAFLSKLCSNRSRRMFSGVNLARSEVIKDGSHKSWAYSPYRICASEYKCMFAASPLKTWSHHNHISSHNWDKLREVWIKEVFKCLKSAQISEGLNISWEHLRDLHECENVCYNLWPLPILKLVKQRLVCDNWRRTETLLEIGRHTVCRLQVLCSHFSESDTYIWWVCGLVRIK